MSHSGDSSRSLVTASRTLGGGVVDLFLGAEAAEGEADRAVRQFVVAAQGAQHVGRLQGRRGAGRAGGDGQVLERHDQRLALDVVEAEVEVVRHALLAAAVEVHLFHAFELGQETLGQRLDAHALGGHLFLGDAEGFAHADDLVGGQGARAHAALVTAAVHLRFERTRGLRLHVERADALGTVGLVRGEGHQVDLHRSRSIATLPVDCAASTWNRMPGRGSARRWRRCR